MRETVNTGGPDLLADLHDLTDTSADSMFMTSLPMSKVVAKE